MCCMRLLNVVLVVHAFWLPGNVAWCIGTTPPSWKPREVVADEISDELEHFGQDRLLAYDHHGNPGIAFFDEVNDNLRYARRVPGVGWVHETVDATGLAGVHPSLAYDRYERPAISHQRGSDLGYSRFDGTAWVTEAIDTAGTVGRYSSLSFDLLGRVAIAYADTTNLGLKYIHDTDGDFSLLDETPVPVSSENNGVFFTSLVFDHRNRPMIAHTDRIDDLLRFSVEEPGIGWVTTTLASGLGASDDQSLAIDPDTGFPAIAYYNTATFDLMYLEWDGSQWLSTTVDEIGSVGRFASLAFDPADGNPAISYRDDSNDALKLAWHDGVSWQSQTVDSVGSVGVGTSLAFNDFGSGFASIAYFEANFPNDDTLYFIDDPPAAVPESASVVLLMLSAVIYPSSRGLFARIG